MIRNTDFLAGLLFLALSIVFGVGAVTYRFGTASNMGAGFLPICLAAVLAILGACILAQAWRKGGEPFELGALRPIVIIIGSILLFAVVLRPLGFAATALVTVFVVTYAGSPVPVLQRLIPAVVLSAVATIVFIKLLGLPIPIWPNFLS